MNDKTLHILNRFSGRSGTLVLLMAENPDFCSLCQDYEDCVNALGHWTSSSAPDASARVKEYRNLVRDLEKEITDSLEAFEPRLLE